MKSEHETGEIEAAYDPPPFLYEIRVKGRLSGEQWTSWFDDLTVTVAQGESTLRGGGARPRRALWSAGTARDLAIPLVTVRVLDAEAQHKLAQTSRRSDLLINTLLVALYLVLLGGLATITVFVAPVINVALALTLLFTLLGVLAHAFWLWSGQRVLALGQLRALARRRLTFLVFIPVSGLMPPALGIAIMLLLLASGLFYAIYSFADTLTTSGAGWLGEAIAWVGRAIAPRRLSQRMTTVQRTRPSKRLLQRTKPAQAGVMTVEPLLSTNSKLRWRGRYGRAPAAGRSARGGSAACPPFDAGLRTAGRGRAGPPVNIPPPRPSR